MKHYLKNKKQKQKHNLELQHAFLSYYILFNPVILIVTPFVNLLSTINHH